MMTTIMRTIMIGKMGASAAFALPASSIEPAMSMREVDRDVGVLDGEGEGDLDLDLDRILGKAVGIREISAS